MTRLEPAGSADTADAWQQPPPICTCPATCAAADRAPCKGECGCERCHEDYGDFLSAR